MKRGTILTQEKIDQALLTCARYGGNARRASEELDIGFATLYQWIRGPHRERYQDLRQQYITEVEQALVGDFRDNALLSAQLQQQATLAALEQVRNGEAANPAQVAQQAAVAAGIATDKLLLISERPTQIVQHRDPAHAINQLAEKLGISAIDATAEEDDSAA